MKKNLALILILAIAFFVRVVGLNYGLPFAYHDDEPIIVNYALSYGTGDFDPHVFKMSPFMSYVLFFLYGIFFCIGYVFRVFREAKDFAFLYLNDPTIFYLIGRTVLGVFCGTGSVILLYFVGKKFFNRTTGILAALFLALNFLHVRDSHYIYFDVPLTFFLLLFLVKAGDFFKITRRKDFILLGICLGLAISVKYSGVMLGLPFALAILYNFFAFRDKKLSTRLVDVLVSGISCLAVLFILNPFSFIHFNEFIRSVSRLPFIPPPPHYHLKVSLVNGCGLPLVIAGILGMLWSLCIKRNRQVVLIAYALAYYFVLNRSSQVGERLVMPLVPIIMLFAGFVVVEISELIRKRKISYLFRGVLAVFLVFPSAIRVYYCDTLFTREDTRTQAYNWIKENVPVDSRMGLDAVSSWFPKLEKSREQIKEISESGEEAQFDKPGQAQDMKFKFMLENPDYPEKTYYLFYLKEEVSLGRGFLTVYPDITFDYQSVLSENIQYVILSHALFVDKYQGFVQQVEDNCQLLKEFSPYREGIARIRPAEKSFPPAGAFMLEELKSRERFGPAIRIYKVKP